MKIKEVVSTRLRFPQLELCWRLKQWENDPARTGLSSRLCSRLHFWAGPDFTSRIIKRVSDCVEEKLQKCKWKIWLDLTRPEDSAVTNHVSEVFFLFFLSMLLRNVLLSDVDVTQHLSGGRNPNPWFWLRSDRNTAELLSCWAPVY